MIIESHIIKEPLNKYIDSILYHKDYVPEHKMERVVPTGNVFLIFELDNIPRNTYDINLQPDATFTKVWVSGIHQNYLTISEHQHSEMLVVQFKTLGAFPFFKLPINSFSETVKPAEYFFGDSVLSLREELVKTKKPTHILSIVEDWLLALLDEKKASPIELLSVLKNFQTNPFSKHNEVISIYPRTQKNLINQFKKFAGLPPKSLHKIIRFNSILQIINNRQEITWTDIAYETGYSDQSHFIKEFQTFSGFSPSMFIKNGYNLSMTNFFPLEQI